MNDTLYISRGGRWEFSNYEIFQSMKIILANKADPDEMLHFSSGSSLFAKAPGFLVYKWFKYA